jgi:hypothetical protein
MTVNLRSIPVQIMVAGVDLSPAFVSLALSSEVWNESGWFKMRGQLELAAFWEDAPESFDCRENPTRWAPGNVVAISVDLGAGWVLLPWRLRILSYPNRPYPGRKTITLELGSDADLLSYRAPEGDPGTDEYGTPTGAKTLINRALVKAGAPALSDSDTITGLNLPFSPEKNTGGSWMTYAGSVAYAARHILWQQADGTIRAVPLTLDGLTPVATYTVGVNEADYVPEMASESPPEKVRVSGSTYEIEDATPQDTDVTENINGVLTRTQVNFSDWATNIPEVVETVWIPLELMVTGKFVGNTALYIYKRTTSRKTYDAWSRLVEEYTRLQMPRFTVPFAPQDTGLMTVGETIVTYEFPLIFGGDPEVLAARKAAQVMNRKVTVERSLFRINGAPLELQDRVVMTETWEEKGPELYIYRINTRDDSAEPLKAPSRNSPPQFQGPPATTFKPAEKQRTEKTFEGEATFNGLSGNGFAEKLWAINLPSGMGISNNQCRAHAQLWGRIRQGRQFGITWAADLTADWLTSFNPVRRVDFTLGGATTAYLVEAFNLAIDQRSAAVGGRGLELGQVVSSVVTPPYILFAEVDVAVTVGRPGAAVVGSTPASVAVALAAQRAGLGVVGVAGVGASVVVSASRAGAAVVGDTPDVSIAEIEISANRAGIAVAGLAGVNAAVAATASRAGIAVDEEVTPSAAAYRRPDGTSRYLRPDGTSTYLRPE